MDALLVFLGQNAFSSLNHLMTRDLTLPEDRFHPRIRSMLTDLTGVTFGKALQSSWYALAIVPILLLIVFMCTPFAPASIRILIACFLTFASLNILFHSFWKGKQIPAILRDPSAYASMSGYFIHMLVVRFAFVIKSKTGISDEGKQEEPSFMQSLFQLCLTCLITTPIIFVTVWLFITVSQKVISPAYMPAWPRINVYKLMSLNIGLSMILSACFLILHNGWVKRTDKCYELFLNVVLFILYVFMPNIASSS